MMPIAMPNIGLEEIEAVTEVLKSGNLAQHQKTEQFEKEFAEYIGTKYAVATSNGTTALQLAILGNGLRHSFGAMEEIITTPFSFVATANSILASGLKPVFVDIEYDTFNINPELIKEKINKKTRAILPVHLFGQPVNMSLIKDLCEDHNLALIEDVAQAHGAEFLGKKVGSFGAGCFSFYPTKNMTTSEGGMITTDSKQIYEKTKKLRNHGQVARYECDALGYNYRMTDISAAIGLCQIKKLDAFNKTRRDNAKYYDKRLKNIEGIKIPKEQKWAKHVYNQYTLRIKKDRDKVIENLEKNKIGYGVYYPKTIPKQELYRSIGYKDELPEAERAAKEVLSIPVHPRVNEQFINKEVQNHIAQAIEDAL